MIFELRTWLRVCRILSWVYVMSLKIRSKKNLLRSFNFAKNMLRLSRNFLINKMGNSANKYRKVYVFMKEYRKFNQSCLHCKIKLNLKLIGSNLNILVFRSNKKSWKKSSITMQRLSRLMSSFKNSNTWAKNTKLWSKT
jgi:hypothetical protein